MADGVLPAAPQDFPTLTLKMQQYTHTNGKAVPLLLAEGTLPMYYQVPSRPFELLPTTTVHACCSS